jgi:hypothetical protein
MWIMSLGAGAAGAQLYSSYWLAKALVWVAMGAGE